MTHGKEIPLKIEVFSDGEDSDFLIHNPKEIKSILSAIGKRRSRAALYYDEGNNFVLSLIIAVDDKGVWIDAAPNEHDNQRIVNSKHLIFVSTHNQAKVQFVTTAICKDNFEGKTALHIPIPKELMRLQRRDYYRLIAKEPNALKCAFSPASAKSAPSMNVTIMDISVGGVGLVCEEHEIELEAGKIYPDCKIELPEVGTLNATLQVKNTFEITGLHGTINRRAGCVFVDPGGQTSMMLHRYVALMQQRTPKDY
jgi:c-di-GMP-binding flagellar brake protein YcgR